MNEQKDRIIKMMIPVGVYAAFFLLSAAVTQAYVYLGHKWSSYPVSVEVDASWPGAWVTPLASSMSAWNAASSSFYFNVGSSGHRMLAANLGSLGGRGVTSMTYSGGVNTDMDTTLNTYYSWSTSGEAGKYDVQSVVTHELGHWLSLDDLYGGGDWAKTMYYLIYTGETMKRTLETDDLNGINYIYP